MLGGQQRGSPRGSCGIWGVFPKCCFPGGNIGIWGLKSAWGERESGGRVVGFGDLWGVGSHCLERAGSSGIWGELRWGGG